MTTELVIALVFVFAFAFTNGIHDASNAIATLVATRAATPAQAMVLAAVFNTLGPLLVGAAVADTIGGIVAVDGRAAIDVIAAGLVAAVAWNLLTWWLGLPSSSGHALVGGLVGAALVEGGTDAVHWGGLDGLRPVGVIGTAIALAVAPSSARSRRSSTTRALRRGLRRGTRRWRHPIRVGEWAMSAGLAFSHGANDAQKAVGLLAALLVADGRLASPSAPTWAVLGVRRRADGGHRDRRLADRQEGRPRHLPHPAGGGAREPGRVGRGDLRRLARRGAGVDLAGRRLVDRRRRRRPPALAARALGGGRRHGRRVGADDPRDGGARRAHPAGAGRHRMSRGRWFLPHDPDVLGVLIRQLAVTIEGMEAFARWAGGDEAPRSPCVTASTGPTWSGASSTPRCAPRS